MGININFEMTLIGTTVIQYAFGDISYLYGFKMMKSIVCNLHLVS